MEYLDKVEKPIGLDLEVRADLALRLSTFVTTAIYLAGSTKSYTFRIMYCILIDDGSRYSISSQTDLVKTLRKDNPQLWAEVRLFLVASPPECECGHARNMHEMPFGSCLGCIGYEADRAIKSCPCKTFAYKRLLL